MTVLPSQKLSIGELFVSLAAGLMLFLLPNDAKNQFETESVCEGFIFIISIVIIAVMFFIIKRYEAIGTSMMTMAVLNIANQVISLINGFVTKGSEYWPKISEYNIVSLFLLWIVPFLFVLVLRLLTNDITDTNDSRRSFVRFMSLSMGALLIIYGIVFVFMLIIPSKPDLQSERTIMPLPFSRINECLDEESEHGIAYLIWHCIIFAPLTFHLSVLIPRFRILHGVILAAALGVAVEALQYMLNTGAACLDDILMYIIGAVIGICLKYAVNALRSVLTQGRDSCMLSLEYNPIPRKRKGEATVIEE